MFTSSAGRRRAADDDSYATVEMASCVCVCVWHAPCSQPWRPRNTLTTVRVYIHWTRRWFTSSRRVMHFAMHSVRPSVRPSVRSSLDSLLERTI